MTRYRRNKACKLVSVFKDFSDIDSDLATPDTVLVVDDSRAQRGLLARYLAKWGYRVLEADSGASALELCKSDAPDLIVSDWMMPGMDGLELCQAYRGLETEQYGYFILLTSKSDKEEVARGLDIGADDFLTKPVNPSELRARIQAGQRLLKTQRELTEKNRLLVDALAEVKTLYDAIDRDLLDARRLQQSLVPERVRRFDGADVSMMLQAANQVGGDLVGTFSVNESEVVIYSIDVSGHGIASALLTARIAAYFSGNSPRQNIALKMGDDGTAVMRAPQRVVETLNGLILNELETEHYLTIALAHVNLKTGHTVLSQAGHPHPVLHRANGEIEFIGTGGFPVGLLPGVTFDAFEVRLCPGDRLFLGSDGITECENPAGEMLDEAGLSDLLGKNAALSGELFFEAMMWDLTQYAGDRDFSDDVSGVLLEFKGQEAS